MAPVFKISNGRCVGIDNEAYKKLSKDAETIIATTMNRTPFRYFPAKKGALAWKMVHGLFSPTGRPEEICRAIASKLPSKNELWSSLERARKGPPENGNERERFFKFLKNAGENGFFMAGTAPSYKCPDDDIEWEKGKYYYSGAPSCEDVKDILEKYKDIPIPATMSVVHMPYMEDIGHLLSPGALEVFFNKNEYDGRVTPFRCTGKVPIYGKKTVDGGKKLSIKGYKDVGAIYNFPFDSRLWALRFIIGTGTLYYKSPAAALSYWHQVPSCKLRDKKGEKIKEYRESKLLFNFGARIFLNLEINVDGRPESRALMLSFTASTTESSGPFNKIRNKFMQTAPWSFYSGELTKMYYFHWLKAK